LIDVDDRIRDICKAMNLIPVMWDLDSGDFGLGNKSPGAPTADVIESITVTDCRFVRHDSKAVPR
jgi:hypothetical protein